MARQERSRSYARLLPLCLLLLCWRSTEGGYVPVYANRSAVFFNVSQSYRFPDIPDIIEAYYNYFISELNFEAISDRIVVGAADKLYLLNTNLGKVQEYNWTTDSALQSMCSDTLQNFACRNHIRVYKKLPGDNRIFVCGTQSAQRPQCRTLSIDSSGGFGVETGSVTASNGLASYYPEFSGFGEFRNSGTSDTTYFSAGFFAGMDGVGRHFSLSYQTVNFQSSTLTTTEQFRTIKSNNYWLRFPVDFVDYYRADFPVVLPATQPSDYQFYFVFLREELFDASSFDIIYSRVVRICRNDPGSAADPVTGARHFTTYMKARIYCEREVPTGREFTEALDYQYNEITSMVFNGEGGRYVESGAWGRIMYGAFSGPTIGPKGTAICAYPADNSYNPSTGAGGYNKGIFDIFREDLLVVNEPPTADAEEQNTFVECNAGGRIAADSQKVLIIQDVNQIGEDPLIVFDGIYITKMVLDQVCVVRNSNPLSCNGQDILFLGTDTGKVMKVVFTADNTPIIAEEIGLDDENAINDMKLETISGSNKQLFVSTNSKIYRLPLERCSRHLTCRECVSARDPYCVWNTTSALCEKTSLTFTASGTGTVTSNIKQSIHTGSVDSCPVTPVCSVGLNSISYNSIQVEVQCNDTNTVMVTTNMPSPQVAACGGNANTHPTTLALMSDGTSCVGYTGGYGLQTYCVNITTPDGRVVAPLACVTTEPGPPPQPMNTEVFADSISPTSFRVVLNVAIFTDYLTNYRFRVFYNTSGSPTSYQTLTDGNSITIGGLTPAETILYWVEVMNTQGSARSVNNFTITLRDSTPRSVQGLTVADITNTSVTLSWTQPAVKNGEINGYTVYLNGNAVVSCTVQSSTQFTITGLQPSTQYTFTVRACTDAGEGTQSDLTATTECGVAGPVQDLVFSHRDSSTLTYTWNAPRAVNGDPSTIQYTVKRECYDPYRGVQVITTNPTATRTGTASDLEPLTYCCVTVHAIHTCEIDGISGTEVHGLPTQSCGQTLDTVPSGVRNVNIVRVSPSAILPTWEPPSNYERQGLNYTITVQNSAMDSVVRGPFTVTDRLSYYINGLTANTQYNVIVEATSAAGMGSQVGNVVTTLPSEPPPPENPRLSVVDSNTLRLMWDDPNRQTYNVANYYAVLRCNEIVQNVTTTDMSTQFTITSPVADFAWCTAQVQAVNDLGSSSFSNLTNIVVPSRAPEQPRCFLVDDLGSLLNISFDVTYPFSVEGMTVEWMLTPDYNVGSPITDSFSFTADTSNRVEIPVSRNTRYSFQLRICNIHGCSDYCLLSNFTTSSSSPRPPDVLNAENVTCCSANITWNLPLFEIESNIEYIAQISSACGTQERRVPSQRWYVFTFTDLCYETNYTVAIKVFDNDSNVEGYYGPAYTFQRLSGIPSKPRDVTLSYDDERQYLEVYWAVPEFPRGSITMYEIQWSNSSSDHNCSNPNGRVLSIHTNPSMKEYKTFNTGNINDTHTVLICVRAYTSNPEPGPWGFDFKENINRGGLTACNMECECSGLIAVAVVAAFAVICSVLMTLILIVVIVKKCPTRVCSYSGDDKDSIGKPEIYNGTNTRPPYDTMLSTGSSSSTSPFFPNSTK